MKLEREATNYMEAKRNQFKKDLNAAIRDVDKFLLDKPELKNLENTCYEPLQSFYTRSSRCEERL